MTRTRPDVPFTKLEKKVDLEGVEGLSGIDRSTMVPDLADPQAIARDRFTVEWGIRATDQALVLHLFPHIVGDNVATEWDETFQMDKRLDHAIPAFFDVQAVNAGFEESMNSFYIIVRGVIVPDLRLLVQRFLEMIEGAPVPAPAQASR